MITRLHFIIPSFALLALTGCISAPPYEGPPQVNLGGEWTLKNDVLLQANNTINEQTLDRWWESFNDPVLNRLMTEGLSRNHDVRYAALKVEEARAILAGSQSKLSPSVSLEGSTRRNHLSEAAQNRLGGGMAAASPRYQTTHYAGTAIAWEIDLFGRIRYSIDANEARFEKLQEDANAVSLSVTTEIARSYFSLRSAQGEWLAQQDVIASLEKTREIVARRIQAGDLSKVEIETIDARLLSAKAAIPDIQAKIRASALALSILSGGLPEKELDWVASPFQGLILPAIPVGTRADILRRRPDIRSAERLLAASSADLKYAVAEQFPKLKISVAGGFEALSSTQWLQASKQTWSILPFISWRIFDGGKVRAEIHAAEARQEMAALAYEKTVLTALNEAEKSMGDYHYQHQAVILWEEAVDAADKILQSQQRRFNAGDVAMSDVLEAQRQFAEARRSLAMTKGNACRAMVDVIKALGGGV